MRDLTDAEKAAGWSWDGHTLSRQNWCGTIWELGWDDQGDLEIDCTNARHDVHEIGFVSQDLLLALLEHGCIRSAEAGNREAERTAFEPKSAVELTMRQDHEDWEKRTTKPPRRETLRSGWTRIDHQNDSCPPKPSSSA